MRPTHLLALLLPLTTALTFPTASSQLLHIAPLSISCPTPPGPECATALTAAPPLIATMSFYALTSPAELAAVLALIAYETADFRYSRNHVPGRPRQGTRNMQMGAFNVAYARSLPGAAEKVPTGAEGDESMQEMVLDVLLGNEEWAWGSGAWYYTTYCGGVREQVREGGEAGWEAYMACVGVQATEERTAYWLRAKEAFGLA